MKTKAAFATAVSLVCAACAGANGPSPEPGPQSSRITTVRQPDTRRSDLLTAGELRALHSLTTLDGVRRLRPEFIRPTVVLNGGRPATVTPSVYLDDAYAGGLDALETIPLDVVEEISYLRRSRAFDRWGFSCRCDGGVIQVKTKGHN
jgi:hypothetical protein